MIEAHPVKTIMSELIMKIDEDATVVDNTTTTTTTTTTTIDHRAIKTTKLSNISFECFYKALNFIDSEVKNDEGNTEFDTFLSVLKEPLPACFR